MTWSWEAFFSYLTSPVIIQGAWTTVWLTAAAILAGLVVGLILAIVRQIEFWPLRVLYSAYTTIIRGTPLLVQLIFIYSGLPQLGIRLDVIPSAILALSINEGAYMAEIIRAGIESIHHGQMEAGKALGMSYLQTMRFVILPQAARTVLPPFGNEVNGVLKSTSLVSVISMEELFRTTEELIQVSFRVLELFTVATIYYLFLTGVWTLCQKAMEARLNISVSRQERRRWRVRRPPPVMPGRAVQEP